MKHFLKVLFTNIYVITYIYLAVVTQTIFLLAIKIFEKLPLNLSEKTTTSIALVIVVFSALLFGYFIGKKKKIKNNFYFSFFPSFLF